MTVTRNESFLKDGQSSDRQFIAGQGRIFVSSPFSLSVTCPISCMAFVLVIVLFLFNTRTLHAGMFVCRDQSGAMNITNVPNYSDCKPLEMKKESSWSDYSYGPRPGSSANTTNNSTRYDLEIRRVSKLYNVDPSLIKAIIHTESDFNDQAVSRSGAQGLMQLMPATARELSVINPFDPQENIDGGTRYFRSLLDIFNEDLVLSLAAYNAGPGRVTRTGGVPEIAETQHYIKKVLKRYKVYQATW
ncbi:MAG: lytic transglycosylase domain-containing protein [Desulforhopalus sp.]